MFARKQYMEVNKKMVEVFMTSRDLDGKEHEDAMKEWNELNAKRWELYAKMMEEEKGSPAKSSNVFTEVGRKIVAWMKENTIENGCDKCGSKVIKIAGMDTDTAWVRCNGCGNIITHEFARYNIMHKREGDYIVLSTAPLTVIGKQEAIDLVEKGKSVQAEIHRLTIKRDGLKKKLDHVCKLLGISMDETIMSVNDKVRSIKKKADEYDMMNKDEVQDTFGNVIEKLKMVEQYEQDKKRGLKERREDFKQMDEE